jgi:hypothetical protein
VVGVPESMPAADSVRPGGSVPLVTVKTYGAVPPEAESVCAYAPPTVPVGNVVGVSVMRQATLTVPTMFG